MDCMKAILNDAAITLLELKTKQRVAQGFDTLLLTDANEILTVANRERVKTKEEQEQICQDNIRYYGWPKYTRDSLVDYLGSKCKVLSVKDFDLESRQYLYSIQLVDGNVAVVPESVLSIIEEE